MASHDIVKEYDAARKTGENLLSQLDNGEPSTTSGRPVKSLYEVELNPLRAATAQNVNTTLAGCGISTSNMVYVEVRPSGQPHVDAVYSNWMDGRNGVLVCNENFKDRDKNPNGQKLYPSEILWQSWAMAAIDQGSLASDLRAIVRLRIINKEAKRIIWYAGQTSSSTRKGPKNYREYTELDHGFHAILGTANGASTLRMLLDHKQDAGWRTVEKVIVLESEKAELTEKDSRSILILLTDRRTKADRTDDAGHSISYLRLPGVGD
ncbi:MAG: hypothetical protein Q9178_007267 [Gyalolechia marmorata]